MSSVRRRTAITHAGRKDYAFYGETDVPIFSPENSVPAFHSLEFTAAARFEAFRNNDTNVLVPKFGIALAAVRRRANHSSTWGEGFPRTIPLRTILFTYFGLLPTHFMGHSDPETTTITSSNPNLQPEDSRASAPVLFTHRSMYQA